VLLAAYLEWMRVKNYSEQTVLTRERLLRQFLAWAELRGLRRPADVTKPVLERYQRYLFHYRRPNGRPLSFASQANRLVPLRMFFQWLARQNFLLSNPASDLELPRYERRLPKTVLTAHEADGIIDAIDTTNPMVVRDRAILETLYSTGIRRQELTRLRVADLDAERGTLFIRLGKGKKDRVVPIGERAIRSIERYLDELRPQLVLEPDEGFLFLTEDAGPLTPRWLSQVVRRHVERAKLGKSGSCHLFRHTVATLMLENGADIRFIQQMLGHASLTTTEIYTQVALRKLKEIHRTTHPAEIDRAPQEGTGPPELIEDDQAGDE
jgi:integrase/recombinase XerD